MDYKKNKKDKKDKKIRHKKERQSLDKTFEERNEFFKILDNRLKLNDMRTNEYEGIKELYKILINYVITGESIYGKIPLPEFGLIIHYFLSNRRGIENIVKLRQTADKKNEKMIYL